MSIHAARHRAARGAPFWLVLTLLLPAVSGAVEPTNHGARGVVAAERPRIGRIFTAPNARPGARGEGLRATPAALPAPPGAARQRTYVNGTLSIGSRPRAVWINGVPVDASSVGPGTHSIRPGQSIGHDGAIEDLLPPGSITRR